LGNKNYHVFEGFQAEPARPSDTNSIKMKVKILQWCL